MSQIEVIKHKVISCYGAAKKAHESIFDEKIDKAVAIGYLNLSSTYANSAYSIYISQYDRLARDELDTFFFELDTFVEEGLSCYRTNHSHQWTDIHFTRLSDKYKSIESILGIT